MPPKRSLDNVDTVDDSGDGDVDEEDEVKSIRIVKSKSDKVEQVICEICSSILKSPASLAKHKKAIHGNDDKYKCTDCGETRKDI